MRRTESQPQTFLSGTGCLCVQAAPVDVGRPLSSGERETRCWLPTCLHVKEVAPRSLRRVCPGLSNGQGVQGKSAKGQRKNLQL